MTTCDRENSTQHYRGRWFGFGPVRSNERVIFAVTAATPLDDTRQRLSASSFSNNIKNCTQSLARGDFVSRAQFTEVILRGGDGQITHALVQDIRNLTVDWQIGGKLVRGRAVCVIDLVEQGDVEGHATMGYCPAATGVVGKQVGKKREFIADELAKTFSDVSAVASFGWPSALKVQLRRLIAILRAVVAR